jgi:hypothetical protein
VGPALIRKHQIITLAVLIDGTATPVLASNPIPDVKAVAQNWGAAAEPWLRELGWRRTAMLLLAGVGVAGFLEAVTSVLDTVGSHR